MKMDLQVFKIYGLNILLIPLTIRKYVMTVDPIVVWGNQNHEDPLWRTVIELFFAVAVAFTKIRMLLVTLSM